MSLKTKLEKIPGYNSLVKPLHWAQAMQAAVKYDFPAKKLRVIAVTGTNGKTTTCFMIWKMLNHAGRKAGLLTTVGWSADGQTVNPQVEHMTTERVSVLNERIRAVADAKAEFLVLEVTSHALSQFRVLGVPIEVAVFTNLTPEHLDYHKTFVNYRKAKQKLFKKARFGVVNADDPNAEYFVKEYASSDVKTYGVEGGDFRATDVKLLASGVQYLCGDIKVKTQIPGEFNIYNSLAAVAVGKRLGLTDKQIEDGVHSLTAVEGRMTRVRAGQDFEVIVDYAHQPDALEKVFASVGHGTGFTGKIIAVHGGAGRRDHATREPRGEILGRESDIVIITEDDSRDEKPAEIAEMFVRGAEKAGKVKGKDLLVELDRQKAIAKALSLAKKDDLVLILGKGHEKTILRADGPYDFEDIKVAEEILRGK
jgi:UDP-N-acetylmuramoyl-L-alanyl-D-glutamate--2,6-diaminopimelate ligase